MDKSACLLFVIGNNGLNDRIKAAAVSSYIDSLEGDEEKIAALDDLESMFKGAGWWQSLGTKMFDWGARMGRNNGLTGRLGNWLGTHGLNMATSSGTGALGAGIRRWGLPLAVGGAIGGAGLLAGQLGQNEAYKRGYGTAVGQLSPMVSALYAPQGAMGMQPPVNMA